MTIKTKKVKEIISNIRQEQQSLNNLRRLDDWEERFIEQSEELEELKEQLEYKTLELENAKERGKLMEKNLVNLIIEEEDKVKALEEKDETKLKKVYEKKITELESRIEDKEKLLHFSHVEELKATKEAEKLSKELEEKELLIEELEKSNLWLKKEIIEEAETHLGAARFAGEMAKNEFVAETKKLKDKLDAERETRQEFVIRLAKKIVENDKLLTERNEEQRGREEEIRRNLKKDEIIIKLETKLHLANRPLPKRPGKFKILKEKVKTKFQNLIEKTKQRNQELVAKIEVKTK